MKNNHNIILLIVLSSIALIFFPILGIIPFTLSIITYNKINRDEDTIKINKYLKWIKSTLVITNLVLFIAGWRMIVLFQTL